MTESWLSMLSRRSLSGFSIGCTIQSFYLGGSISIDLAGNICSWDRRRAKAQRGGTDGLKSLVRLSFGLGLAMDFSTAAFRLHLIAGSFYSSATWLRCQSTHKSRLATLP